MFGRSDECAAAAAAMRDPSVRLVTLTGRGGVGKTRLAMEVEHELRSSDGSPTTVVALAGVSGADLVVPAVATALGVPPASTDHPDEVVAARFGGDQHALVLDNLEHVIDVAPRLSALLDRCAGLRILATSQAPLRLRCEHVVRVEPFVLPPGEGGHGPGAVDRSHPAVATYLAAALAADVGFELRDGELGAVVELCRRVEGLPLAIELAGARAASLRPAEVLRCLEAVGIGVLSRPRGDAPTRHHDLGAAIGWTYDLLPPAEQRLLSVLSVGAGTFSIDTVLAAAEGDPADALDRLSSLVDWHLVDRHLDERAARGYSIPSSIRQHADRRAAEAGEVAATRRRYVAAWGSQAHAAADSIESGASGIALALDVDGDGLGAALQVALDDGLVDDALDLVRVLAERWDTHGYHRVHEALLERCLAAATDAGDGVDPVRYARASTWSAMVGLRHSSTRSQDELLDRLRSAEAVGERTGDDGTILFALAVRMLTVPITQDVQKASEAAARALDLVSRPANARWSSAIRVWAGMLAYQSGDVDQAVELGRAALDDARATGDRGALARTTLLLAPITTVRPELLADVPSNEEALELARNAGQPFYEAVLQTRLVADAVASGESSRALAWAEQSLLMARAMLGSPFVGFQLSVAASALASTGDWSTSARLHGVVRPVLPLLDAYLSPQNRASRDALFERARAALGVDPYEAELALGSGLSWPDAVELALDAVREGLAWTEEPIESHRAEGAQRAPTPALVLLTERQRDVLRLLATGKSNKDIATELGIAAKTVMHHTVAIYRALGVRGRNEATAWAFQTGFLDRG